MNQDQEKENSIDRTERQIDDNPTVLKPWTAPRLLKQKDCNGKVVHTSESITPGVGPS